MSTKTPTLAEAVAAAGQLSEHEQTVLAAQTMTTIEHGVLPPPRSAEDQAIIAARMRKSRTYISRDKVEED